jgi:hypothetical protein
VNEGVREIRIIASDEAKLFLGKPFYNFALHISRLSGALSATGLAYTDGSQALRVIL